MTREQYQSVLDEMRLGPGGAVFPMPITLDVSDAFANQIESGSQISLRDRFSNVVGVMTVTDKWVPDKTTEAQKVFLATDDSHPGVAYLVHTAGPVYLGGTIEAVARPHHYDFKSLRRTPKEVREHVTAMGWSKFIAFQTRNPMHRAHIELTRLASKEVNAGVLIHPVVGMTKPGDVEYHVRVRCYLAMIAGKRHYDSGAVSLSLLPLAMRMAGPREALWHAIIRKNHGATHFIVGRDHAGCKSSTGVNFYADDDAQIMVAQYAEEVGITMVKFQAVEYVESLDRYLPQNEIPAGAKTAAISGTQFRQMMATGADIPAWFSDPDVIKILRQVSPPLPQRGFTVFFTGLSGSGKSTVAAALAETIRSVLPTRPVTMLDGDVVRTHLSKNLGFSVDDRNTNIARIGFVAAAVTREGGIAIAPTIAPFESSRAEVREMVEATQGGFLMVHISTSLEECERRDVKGLYAKARTQGMLITGSTHPYENPEQAELTIDAGTVPVEMSVRHIMGWLVGKGYIPTSTAPEFQDAFAAVEASQGILTEARKDNVGGLCRRDADTTLVLVLGTDTAGLVAAAGAFRAKMTDARVVATSDILEAERHAARRHAVATGCAKDKPGIDAAVEAMVPELEADWGKASYDSAWRHGVQALSALPEGSALEAAWDSLQRALTAGSPGSTRLIEGPRLMRYVVPLLRMHPCTRLLAVVSSSGPDQAAEALVAADPAHPDAATAKQYISAAEANLRDAATRFGPRVALVSGAQEAREAAETLLSNL